MTSLLSLQHATQLHPTHSVSRHYTNRMLDLELVLPYVLNHSQLGHQQDMLQPNGIPKLRENPHFAAEDVE